MFTVVHLHSLISFTVNTFSDALDTESAVFIKTPISEITKNEVEVKAGTTGSVTCKISNVQSSGVTVTWTDGTETLSAETSSVSNGVQHSVLSVENVQADSIFTCRVVSNAFPASESVYEILHLKKYGKLISFEFFQFFCDDINLH